MSETLSFEPEWLRNPSSSKHSSGGHNHRHHSAATPTSTPSGTSHFPPFRPQLAQFRYGREDMLSTYTGNFPMPSNIANLPTLVRTQFIPPLLLSPLSEEEQYAMSGAVNSGVVHGRSNHRGGYYSRGGRNRGRGGRPDYYRTSSGGENDYHDRGYYRTNSDSWEDGHNGGGGYTGGRGGRALRDGNWRSTNSSSSDAAPPNTLGWNNHWHQHQQSGTPSPVKPAAGRAWNKGDGSNKKDRWQPLPEWATDDTKTNDSTTVGVFDGKGQFSLTDKPNSDTQSKEPVKESDEPEEDPSEDNVFEDDADDEEEREKPDKDCQSPPSQPSPPPRSHDPAPHPFSQQQVSDMGVAPNVGREVPNLQEVPSQRDTSTRISSVDSMEDIQRRMVVKAAEAVLSTDEETPSPTASKPDHTPQSLPQTTEEGMDKWLYRDPQEEVQGPFTHHEMQDWYEAGYFTMDLYIKRVCDAMMIPLGQCIRIWRRVPFSPGPQPPPIKPGEPFWQQMFEHQHQLFPQATALPASTSHTTAPPPQSLAPPTAIVSTPVTEPSPIWGVLPSVNPSSEEQWPDLVSQSNSHTQHLEDERKKREKEIEEKAKQIQEENQRQLEEQIRREEEERKQKEAAERKKLEEMERRRQEEIERRRKEEERRRKEQELKKKEEEERQRQERLQQEREEAERLLKQREEEERQRKAEEARLKQLHLQQQQQQPLISPSAPTSSTWTPVQTAPPSLVEIQQEEKYIADIEMAKLQEQHMLFLQQQALAQQSHPSWSSTSHHTSKPKSFLEIQEEQQRQLPSGERVGKSSKATTHANPASSSWSKIASSRQTQNSQWDSTTPSATQRSHTQQRTQPVSQAPPSNKGSQSFWEDCAAATSKTASKKPTKTSGGSRAKDREEEKVRHLFSATTLNDPFNQWCARELSKFNTDIDVATFVSFLLEVESTYEVHDYIKSYLGETDAVHMFAKQFLEKRQSLKPAKKKAGSSNSTTTSSSSGAASQDTSTSSVSRNSKKKKKGKGMQQKVSPSTILGFTVNAAERPNAGEIQSAHDVM